MNIYLQKENFNNLRKHLALINKYNKVANNYVKIEKLSEGNFKITTLADNKTYLQDLGLNYDIFYNETLNCNIFDKRDNFIALVRKDCLDVNTSVELHLHSCYSLLDGLTKIEDLAEKSDYACALTDHGVMYGCLDFYKKMKSRHKKAIIGFEAYTESIDGDRYKEGKPENYHSLINNHLILLAKNEIGYKNLCKINSLAQKHKADFKTKKPRVKYEWLRKYNEGIICSTACIGGELPRAILSGDKKYIKNVLENLIDIFGKENLYLEIQRHNIKEENIVARELKILSKKYGLKIIATVDSHYLNKEDKLTHEAQLCLQTKKTMGDLDRWVFPGEGYHYHTSTEKEELFKDCPEALFNTLEVMDKCNFEYELGNYKLPKFPIPKGYTESEYFRKLCLDGFEERFPVGSKEHNSLLYKERLEFEINTIIKMGYPSYFLIVWDFLKFARENDIGVGPGRGSACGSLISYLLHITDIDPLKYDLLFERFLNPDRISLPDIDNDLNNLRRKEIINYCREKYGVNSVSKIVTFSTLAAKNSILDTARVWNKSIGFARNISDKIPSEPNMTIKKALEKSIDLKQLYDNDMEVKDIVDKAMKIEGIPRDISIHACGVIICNGEINDYCPQVYLEDSETKCHEASVQLTMGECEEIGLLKVDFLGLKTMSVIQDSVETINKIYGENLKVDTIPINDPDVYNHIAKGNTNGVFQLESRGMTNLMSSIYQDVTSRLKNIDRNDKKSLSKFGEELFERLIAGIALYRPGPMKEIPNYVHNMLNEESIEYDTPKLKNILKTTYGITIYQEQAMLIVRELAGFSKGQADTIRKGMAKKVESILNEYGKYFVYGSEEVDKTKKENERLNIKGCIKSGIEENIAINIWEKLKAFGSYAFNKSHSTGYSLLSVKTAWLSYYYPAIFMKSNLNIYIDNKNKIKSFLSNCFKNNINVLPPSVNKSGIYFEMEDKNSIIFGLRGIKNLKDISYAIIEEREERGKFTSYRNFVERMVIHKSLNKSAITSLILSGALDEFEGSRKGKLSVIDALLKSLRKAKKMYVEGSISLFEMPNVVSSFKSFPDDILNLSSIKEYDKKEFLKLERDCLGFYITEHPLDSYIDILKEEKVIPLKDIINHQDDLEEDSYMEDYYNNKQVKIAGIIKSVEVKYSKKGNYYAVFTLEDFTNEIDCLLFDIGKNADIIKEGESIIAIGKYQSDESGRKLIFNKGYNLSYINKDIKEFTVISNDNVEAGRDKWKRLLSLCTSNEGNVSIKFIQNGQEYNFPRKINLKISVLDKIQNLFGENNCKVNI